jgi:DNA-binding NarL/FixJ family response regulator
MAAQKPVMVAVGRCAPLVAVGLRALLGEDRSLRVVGVNLGTPELKAAVGLYGAHVVVLGEETAVDRSVLSDLRAVRSTLGLLVLAHRPSRSYVLRVLGLGLSGCISMAASADDLRQAVRAVAHGTHLVPVGSDWSVPATGAAGAQPLTVRESRVLELLSAGRSNAEIALELHIAIETARTHVASIFRKLGVNSRHQLLGVVVAAPHPQAHP